MYISIILLTEYELQDLLSVGHAYFEERIFRIKKQGFPVHYPFKDFKARYLCINIKNRFKIPKDEKEGVRWVQRVLGDIRKKGKRSSSWNVNKRTGSGSGETLISG
jgi:hypothetical protein